MTLKRSLFCITTYLTVLIAHYVKRGAHLYRNLSNRFDSKLHWKGRSFVSEFFWSSFISRIDSFSAIGFLICDDTQSNMILNLILILQVIWIITDTACGEKPGFVQSMTRVFRDEYTHSCDVESVSNLDSLNVFMI